MSEEDPLYTCRNAFFLGNYQECLAEAETVGRPKNDGYRLEKEVLIARSYLGQGEHGRVLGMVKDDAPAPLQAVKLLAKLSSLPPSDSAGRAGVLASLDALLASVEGSSSGSGSSSSSGGSGSAAASVPLVQAVAATAFIAEGALERALRATRSESTLELLALSVQAYLRLDRPDLAEGAVRKLGERDDESALYQLSAAHTYAALGGEKAKEAVLILKDVLDRYGEGAGPAAMNGLVAAYIAARNYSAAEKLLAEAAAKDPSFPDTLANMVTLAHLQGKTAAADKALARLKAEAPGHPILAALAIGEGQLDRVVASFA